MITKLSEFMRCLLVALVALFIAVMAALFLKSNDVQVDEFGASRSSPQQDSQPLARPDNAPAGLAVGPTAPVARVAAANSVPDWSKLTTATPAEAVFQKVGSTSASDETAVALKIATICVTTQSWSKDDLLAQIAFLHPELAGTASTLTSDVVRAQEMLSAYCTPLIERRDFEENLTKIRKLMLAGAGYNRQTVGLGAPQTWTPEQTQAVLLVLANPTVFPIPLERALASLGQIALPRGLPNLSSRQWDEARLAVYQELTGDRDRDSIQNLFYCVNLKVCSTSSATESTPTGDAAAFMLGAIRGQRWSQLGIPN